MEKELGILVCTTKFFHHVMGLTKAARKAGIPVRIFFTGDATLLTKNPSFEEITKLATVKVCNHSYEHRGLEGLAPGLERRDHSNQMENALLVSEVDRYVVF